jgi:hypothetical protein
LKGIFYQSFLEYNIRYLLAEKTQKYLDYQKDLENFKHFYQVAKKLLGPYWQEEFLRKVSRDHGVTSKRDVLASKDIEDLFSRSFSEEYASDVKNVFLSGSSGGKHFLDEWRTSLHQAKFAEKEQNYSEEAVEEVPGLFKKILEFFFSIVTWIANNKEVLLILYGFMILIFLLASAAKR